jgi:multidrug resistance efflux pump
MTTGTIDDADAARAAVRLYGMLLGAQTLREAAHRLVAQLATLHQASRVSVGLRDGALTRLAAVSNADIERPHAELPQLLVAAMDESLEQAVAIVEPAHPNGGHGDGDAIRLGHAALCRAGGACVATVPLGCAGEPIGAVCLERHADAPFRADELVRLQATLELAAPLLALLQRAEEALHRRLRRRTWQAVQALRQPERRMHRRALGAAALALLAAAALPLQHDVAGRARIEGATQRVLVAPTDGFVKVAHARPGDRVSGGAALVELMEQDLQLERERWASQLAQHENAYAAAMAKADRGQAAVAMARADEAQAQLALLDAQLGRSRITAPFDGIVIEGDLSRSVGAPVRQGDALLTLAAGNDFRVIVEIDETEIPSVRAGQRGVLSVSGLPWGGHPVQVERIGPLARAVDGRNVFEVEARLLETDAALRPGLLGRAEIAVGRWPPLWVWAGRAADRLRLAWWRWLG